MVVFASDQRVCGSHIGQLPLTTEAEAAARALQIADLVSGIGDGRSSSLYLGH